MSLTLSSDDLARLNTALATIVSPLDHTTVESWGLAVLHAGEALVGADQGFVGGPLPGRPIFTVVQDANGAAAARDYWAYYHQVDVAVSTRRRELGLEVYDSDMLYRPGEREHDELHNDWVRPYRLHDTLGMSVSVPEHPTFPFLVHFYHECEKGPRFGERGLALLSLLLPAFKASVQAVRQFHQVRADLARLLDSVSDGLLLFDLAGALLHQNAAATRLLAEEPRHDSARLIHEARQVAMTTGALLHRTGKQHGAEIALSLSRHLRTSTARYRLAGNLLRQAAFGREPVVAVALARDAAEPLSDATLRSRFGLTAREIQVARLMAAGKSDGEIARLLGVSIHTGRRHSEHVRRKLGVRSRSAVGARLSNRIEEEGLAHS